MALVGYRVIEISLPDRLRLDTHLLPGDTSANLFRNINVDYVEIHDDRDPVPVSANAETATTRRPVVATPRSNRFASPPASSGAKRPGTTRRGDVRSRHRRSHRRQPSSGGHPRPELPREGDRDREKRRRDDRAEVWTRVHVHESVERIWLTPNPMTVHETPDTAPRFALFAEFDDGVVTDITRIGLTVPAWTGRVTWTSTPDAIATVTANGRVETHSRGTRKSPRRSSRRAEAPRSPARRRHGSCSRGTRASISRW